MSKAKAELLLQALVFYSIITYIIEIQIGADHTLPSHPFFLWSERFVAATFTVEYIARLAKASSKLKYIVSPFAIIDLIAILPFYLGFLIDMRSLRLVRTLRLLRIMKLSRYNEAMRNVVQSFVEVKRELQIISALVIFFVVFGSIAILEAERDAQPDKFATIVDSVWWCVVTLTTVGYGDSYPVTIAGRLIAIVIVLSGLGIFGTFVSLIGSAFVRAVQRKDAHTITLSDDAVEYLKCYLIEKEVAPTKELLMTCANELIIESVKQKGVYV